MKNVEVEIYVSQVINFFEKNPDELKILIGDLDKEKFYQKIKERAYLNLEDGDVELTRNQLIEIILVIYQEDEVKEVDPRIYETSKFGPIFLN